MYDSIKFRLVGAELMRADGRPDTKSQPAAFYTILRTRLKTLLYTKIRILRYKSCRHLKKGYITVRNLTSNARARQARSTIQIALDTANSSKPQTVAINESQINIEIIKAVNAVRYTEFCLTETRMLPEQLQLLTFMVG